MTFGYCRQLVDGLPCDRALLCFELEFPVVVYFQRILRPETFRRCFEGQRQGRYESFLEVVARARERVDDPDLDSDP